MARKQYMVFISPVHGIQLGADEMALHQTVLEFRRDGQIVAQFSQYQGWLELEETKREPGSLLTLVPKPGEPLPGVPPEGVAPA